MKEERRHQGPPSLVQTVRMVWPKCPAGLGCYQVNQRLRSGRLSVVRGNRSTERMFQQARTECKVSVRRRKDVCARTSQSLPLLLHAMRNICWLSALYRHPPGPLTSPESNDDELLLTWLIRNHSAEFSGRSSPSPIEQCHPALIKK